MLEMRQELTLATDLSKRQQHSLALRTKEVEALKLKLQDLQDYRERFEQVSHSKV